MVGHPNGSLTSVLVRVLADVTFFTHNSTKECSLLEIELYTGNRRSPYNSI